MSEPMSELEIKSFNKLNSRPSGIPATPNFICDTLDFCWSCELSDGTELHGELAHDSRGILGSVYAMTINYPNGRQPECGQPGILSGRRKEAEEWLFGSGFKEWLAKLQEARTHKGKKDKHV